jgi:asparagine synthase (glutamine-hydrolysing)
MCGIFFIDGKFDTSVINGFYKIMHRGPDSSIVKIVNERYLFGFHRLEVNGLDNLSNQPFNVDGVYLICNGEIYNYKELVEEHDITLTTNSDCEVIIHLYKKYGMKKTLTLLHGVFALVLYDSNGHAENKDKYYIARDRIGIRSLYYVMGKENDNADRTIYVASEMKAIHTHGGCYQFRPGDYYDSSTDKFEQFLDFKYEPTVSLENTELAVIHSTIREKLIKAVDMRLMSDRPIGCILSGGLDSTLVTALVCKHYKPYSMNTFTIGLEGSVDLKYAKIASDHLKTNHREFVITESEFLASIDETIKQVESYCTTTVRASVGNYLVSKYISNHVFDKVIFCGDVADEIFGSYRGFMSAENKDAFFLENQKMIENISYFDVLRSDKSISAAGLEARVPFGDLEFVKYVMSIDPSLKMFDDVKIEKDILRKSFEGYLPDELLYRRKEAFSDGVSSHARSWHTIIQEYVDGIYTDENYNKKVLGYTHNIPYDKESLYYREIFEKYYPNQAHTIPYFWKQPFSKNLDPSARMLDTYKKEN